MAPISPGKPAASCAGCYAWGQLPGRYCHACNTYAQLHEVGVCTGCQRRVTVDDRHRYCRLCRAQATWAIKACGSTSARLAVFLARVRHQQLSLAGLQRPRGGGPPVGKRGRRRTPRAAPEPVRPRLLAPGWVQLALFTAVRDFTRFNRSRDADPGNPSLVAARREARAVGESRGWNRALAAEVDRALVVVLSGHAAGELLRFSELFDPLRRRGLAVGHTIEVLDRLGLYLDDRTPTVEVWLHRKLHGVTANIARVVADWARVLLDGGPRSRPRTPHTAWGYLNEITPVLLAWSDRYDDLREVTRRDVLAVRDEAAAGKQREALLVALRSLFTYAKKAGKIFTNPTSRIHVPRAVGGVLQPLDQADIDEAVATATKPHTRLIIALAAVHAARPAAIRAIQIDDVDLGNRRITIANHIRPLDDLTRHALLVWLDYRRGRWPNTANHHLLVTQQTAAGLGPAGKHWTTDATRNLTATLEALRVDRQLEEALIHGPDPLHLAVVFGVSEKTAIRYTDSVKQILEDDIENHPAGSPRTQASNPGKQGNQSVGSR